MSDIKKKIKARWFMIWLLAATFTFSNTGLYIQSANMFPEHFGLTDYPLSEFSKDSLIEKIIFISIFAVNSIILGYCNQKSYFNHIENIPPEKMWILKRFLSSPPQLSSYSSLLKESSNPSPKKIDHFFSGAAAFLKAGIASASFAALLRIGFKTRSATAIDIAAPFFFGNLASQFGVLKPKGYQPELFKKNGFIRFRTPLAHFLTFCYNITNTILYFNAVDNFLKDIEVIDHRLIHSNVWWQYAILTILVISSTSLFISTQYSYSKEVAHFLGKITKPWGHTKRKFTPFFTCSSFISTTYKMVVNSISLIAVFYSLFIHHLGKTACFSVGSILAALCGPGNWFAQYGVMKPLPSKEEWQGRYFVGLRPATTRLSV